MIQHHTLRNHIKALSIGLVILAFSMILPTALGWVSYDFSSDLGRWTLAFIVGILPIVYVVGFVIVRVNNNAE